MNRLTTLILAVLAIGAFFYIRTLGDPPVETAVAEPLIPEEILAGVQEIECMLFSREVLKLEREPGGHFIMRFGRNSRGEQWLYQDEVRQALVAQLLRALEDSTRTLTLEGEPTEDDLLRTQLEPAKYWIAVRSEQAECRIHFGSDVPGTFDIYARVEGENSLFQTGRQVPNILEYNVQDWRETQVFDFDPLTVNEVEVVRYQGDEEPEVLVAVREGSRNWRIHEPRILQADSGTLQSLVHQACNLQIVRFLGQDLLNPKLSEMTGIPDSPRGYVLLKSGAFAQTLEVGFKYDDEETAARLLDRDENLTLALDAEALQRVFEVDFESLRSRVFTPAIESTTVMLEAKSPSGDTQWHAERTGLHPRGDWSFTVPFERSVHEGVAPHSWPQVVAEFDRLEIQEFLGPDYPFEPEIVLTVQWLAGQIRRDLSLEVMREGDRVLARASDQAGEVVVAQDKLRDIAFLDPRLHQDRLVLPAHDEYLPKATKFLFEPTDGRTIHLKKKPGANPPEAVLDTHDEGALLTSAVSNLYGYPAVELLPEESVSDSGFDSSRFRLTLASRPKESQPDQEVVITVGGEGPRGFYCRVEPTFPGLLVVIERNRLQDLLDLAAGDL